MKVRERAILKNFGGDGARRQPIGEQVRCNMIVSRCCFKIIVKVALTISYLLLCTLRVLLVDVFVSRYHPGFSALYSISSEASL